jgi:hypothetical protein
MPGGETASFAPTLTFSTYGAFDTIWGLLIFVKVGARFPRPHLFMCYQMGFLCLSQQHWRFPRLETINIEC